MKHHLRVYAVLSLMSTCLFWASPVQSQRSSPCSNDNQERPSSNRREIINREYGLRFQIPANYYTELRRGTGTNQILSIAVRNPADVRFMECAERERMRGYGHQVSDVIVSLEPRPSNIRNVRDIVQEVAQSGGGQIVSGESGFTTIAGREAVVYTVQTVYPERYRYARLIHPNGRYIVNISTGDYGERIDPIDLQVMNLVMSSIAIAF